MRTFAKSLRHALRGIGTFFGTQRNARIHLAIALAAVVLGAILGLTPGEWTTIVLAIGLVLGLEAANTSLEFLADAVHPDAHPLVGKAKDVAAAAVLFASIAAAIAGIIIFLPKLL